MHISQVKIKGFRNFKDSVFNFNEKTLIIGPNDIGKSNLIYALRILLDKSFSEYDLEPKDSDFFVYEETEEIYILIKFANVDNDCIRAKFKEKINENNELFICYKASIDIFGEKPYSFWAGKSEGFLEEINGRFYIKYLNIDYVQSNRDLLNYLKREKKKIIEETKKLREEAQITQDTITLDKIKKQLSNINRNVSNLNYIKNSTQCFNRELKSLSLGNSKEEIHFDSGAIDPDGFVDDLNLISKIGSKNICLGGDGRCNQILLAMWASRNNLNNNECSGVTIYCIEEPEAHLHPHQQRKLAEYLYKTIGNQIILTTHSPQIACEFSPNSMIKLSLKESSSIAINEGCSKIIEEAFENFGYRLNILPAEAFYSNLVFLVEGVSEVLFYKALAKAIEIDLDYYNISIVSVEGVGFDPYVKVYTSLGIPVVAKTDNDVFKIPYTASYRLAGFERCISIHKSIKKANNRLFNESDKLKGFDNPLKVPTETLEYCKKLRILFENNGIYISGIDLETDLYNSKIKDNIINFYFHNPSNIPSKSQVIEKMKDKKGIYMYDFLESNQGNLASLNGSNIAKPIKKCKQIVENHYV